MKSMMFRFAIAAGLAVGAWFSQREAGAAERAASAKEQIVTLRYGDVEADADAATRATVAYWLGRYDAVVGNTLGGGDDTAADAEILLTAANAAFRQSQLRMPGAGNREPATMVQSLDGVLQAYASALKASPQPPHGSGAATLAAAAYNFEYVARLRDQVARSPGKIKPAPAPAAARAGDLPAGPTIHGSPGMPPPDARMEDLDMLAPLDYGDREAQPEATPGAKRERKG